jgi:photosystem II stability/assembly factor-like uncharacterized protein
MPIATVLTRVGRLAALSMVPLAAFAADGRTCTMRDAAVPTKSLTYVLCTQGIVLVTGDDGVKWDTRATGAKNDLRAIAFLDASRGFVVGDGGTLLATADEAKTWQPRPAGTTENLTDIQMIGEQGWVSGFNGVILHTADGGRTWSRQNTGTAQSMEAIHFLDAANGWAVGWAGTILHTVDGGASWQPVKSAPATWSLSAIYFRNPKDGWIVGFAGQLLHTADGGVTWEARKAPVNSWLTSILFDSANRGWITTDDGLLLSEDGGGTWRLVPTGLRFLSKLVSATGAVWALCPFGMMKQSGAGTEWKKIDNPLSGMA